MSKKISRANQKLLFWLIDDYACHLAGLKAGGKTTAYWKQAARDDLTKRFKMTFPDIDKYKPFQFIKWEGSITADEAQDLILKELQMILLSSSTMLSLAQHYMTNEIAIELTGFIFDFFLENEIEMKQPIKDLYNEQQGAKYTIACIKNRKCVITGKAGELHHVEHVGMSGYKRKDVTELLVLPLNRENHNLAHSKGDEFLIEKYHLKPVPHKLAIGTYTTEEIESEINSHKNPNKQGV